MRSRQFLQGASDLAVKMQMSDFVNAMRREKDHEMMCWTAMASRDNTKMIEL